jgi:hypothetical protein
MLASFCGVLLIVGVSSFKKEALEIGDIGSGETRFYFGVIANALCAISFAIINVIVRSTKTVHHSLVASF